MKELQLGEKLPLLDRLRTMAHIGWNAIGNEAADEIERLTAELSACRQECEGLRKQVRILQIKANASLANNLCPDHRDKQSGKPCLACSIESAEAQLNELQAKYAGAVDALEIANDFLTAKKETLLPWDMNSVPLNKIAQALASTPQSVNNLLAVLEAANKLLNPPIPSATYMVRHGTQQVCGPDLEGLKIAYRKWEGK